VAAPHQERPSRGASRRGCSTGIVVAVAPRSALLLLLTCESATQSAAPRSMGNLRASLPTVPRSVPKQEARVWLGARLKRLLAHERGPPVLAGSTVNDDGEVRVMRAAELRLTVVAAVLAAPAGDRQIRRGR
jgi:hypothetical protein